MDSALAVAALPATAAAAGAAATIDRTQAAVGEQLQLTVTVEGSQLANPELPDLSAFEVHQAGTSRQFQFINGRTSSSVVFTYILVPRSAGSFTVGPVRVEVDGQTLTTKPFTLTIQGAEQAPRGGVPGGGATGGGAAGGGAGEGAGDLFMTAKVSNPSPYVGEQVIYTLRVYRRAQLTEANVSIPDFDGFLVEQLGEQRDYTTVVNGREYEVTELRRALFPTAAGEMVIPAASLSAQVVTRRRRGGWIFDPFGGGAQTQQQTVRSSPTTLGVRPLPAQPRDFSGLVGQFDAAAQVSKTDLKVGESTTLTVVISGTGNARSIPEPRLTGLDAFKVYDDKPVSAVDTAGDAVKGSKTFRRSLVPLSPGELTLPSVSVVYFDPAQGSYRTARTAPTVLRVQPSEGKEDLRLTELIGGQSGKVAVKVLADDIQPIYPGLDALGAPGWAHAAPYAFGGSVVVPPLLFAGLAGSRRRREREAGDTRLRRRRTALGTGTRGLKGLGRASDADLPIEASRVLRTFLGDALGVEGLALTPREAGDSLRRAGASGEDAGAVETLLGRLEAAQYGAGPLAQDARQSLPRELETLMARLDRSLPKELAA